MQAPDRRTGLARREYVMVWRYGPLLLLGVGLALLAFGASGLCSTAISLTILPLGFLLLVIGVVLPRIEGNFSASPTAVTAAVLRVDRLDAPMFSATGPATAPGGLTEAPEPIKLGDVRDALAESHFQPVSVQGALGSIIMEGSDGKTISLPQEGLLIDWRVASDDMLSILSAWGVRPVASGKYPAPPDDDPVPGAPHD